MSIRGYLKRVVLIAYGVILVGAAFLFVPGWLGVAGDPDNPGAVGLGTLGFGLGFVGVLILAIAVRCPKCEHNLFRIAASPFSVQALNYCPSCGVSMSDRVPGNDDA